MKQIVTIIVFLFCLNLSFSQSINQLEVDDKGKEKLIGKINREGLEQNSFKEWFDKNYENYLTNDNVIKSIKGDLKDYTIKVFLGTWCGDSKREVPRFYKILDKAKFPESQLEVIALNSTKEMSKQSPTHEEKGLNIHRVPTFIFYKDGKEVNRIVESPKQTLERDVENIVTGKRYRPNYAAVTYLELVIEQTGIDSLKTTYEPYLLVSLPEFVKGSRELNTYGYVQLRAKNIDKALYVLDLNTKLFPHNKNTFDSLGEAHFEVKNYDEALKNYYKVLAMDPKDKTAAEMVEKIKTSMK